MEAAKYHGQNATKTLRGTIDCLPKFNRRHVMVEVVIYVRFNISKALHIQPVLDCNHAHDERWASNCTGDIWCHYAHGQSESVPFE